ncbi:MAG: DUF393 domain-containing protein [Candidatus Eremiobacteraeota bacterium]|nr:DUF393 domain-containing protein [Candidatus Eremiobacteraeota bacterium]
MCHLCDGSVRFIAANDPAARFRFAALQSPETTNVLARFGREPGSFDSVVLVDGDRLYERSDAALRIAAGLRAPWNVLGLLLALPQSVRDAAYEFVARNRYRVFGKRASCSLPDPAFADRFVA